MGYYELPPEARTIKSLVKASAILALIFGILVIIMGIAIMFLMIGIGGLVGIVWIFFGIIDLLIWKNCKEIIEYINLRRYRKAKEKTLVWMIIGFIFGGIIIGILLLIAYIKYDNVIRLSQHPTEIPPPPS